MKMDVTGVQLSSAQPLKLPIPKLHNTTSKYPEMLIPNNWTPATQFLPTTCQPMLTTSASSMSKPTQNKRGRKPLSKMPETKKHIQNLTNQRAFRKRREDYVRTLENKAATYEMLYAESQNDLKMLRDKVNSLERRLAKAQARGNHDDKSCSTSVYQENDTSGDITYDDGNRLSTITPTTMSSFSFNERRYQQKPDSPISPTKSVESVEDIINNPVFCETKEGEICFCESVEGFSVDNVAKEQSQLPPTGRCYINQKEGKRMWIIPKRPISQYPCNDSSQTSRECCPTLPLPEQSQWPSQQRQVNYFSQSSSPIHSPDYTQHHPLNLRLILGDHSDESSDDSA